MSYHVEQIKAWKAIQRLADAFAPGKPEGAVVEMVWVVTNVDRVNSGARAFDAMLAFASERAALDYVHDEINETLAMSTLRDSHLAKIEEWRDAETKPSTLVVGPFSVTCLVVQL